MTVSNRSTALLDRVVRWHLDPDGDLYGDERERLRWYEGIAAAASVQWLALPWAAAILVWILGRPSVLPYPLFVIGACYAYREQDADLFQGATIGGVVGGALSIATVVVRSRRRRQREAAFVGDEG